jgi:polysaccharide transporter, PST family
LSLFFEDNSSDDGHSRRALRSGAVSIVARSINALIQIGSVLFLARLLSPEDYGLAGMVAAITGFAPLLVDLGSRDAIVQRPRIREREISALFWMTQGVGVTCALVVAASGPLIAWFYSEPRLTMIAMVSSLTFVTSAATAQHYALLRRAMMFREIGTIEVIANLLGAVLAIAIALAGLHYWALVLRPIAAATFLALGAWLQCRWMPRRPQVTEDVKEMVKFGLNVTGFTMTDFVGRTSDRVAVGYRSGPAALGYYQNALFVYDNVIDIVVAPLHGVAVAGLSKLRTDRAALVRSWEKALSTLVFFSMPGFALLAVTGHDVIVLLLGPKWAPSGALLSVLALRGIPHSVERTCGWLHVTAGRTDRWMRWGAFLACAQIAALAVALPFGPIGVAWAYVATMFVLFVPAIVYSGRPFGIRARDVIRAVWRPLLATGVALIAGLILRGGVLAAVSPLLRVAASSAAVASVYLVTVTLLLGVTAPLQSAWSLCADFLPARLSGRGRATAVIERNRYESV